MKDKLDKLLASLDDNTKGFSSRKLSAFAIMVCVIVAHIALIKHMFMLEDFGLYATMTTLDYGFIATLLGLTTYSKLKKEKENN